MIDDKVYEIISEDATFQEALNFLKKKAVIQYSDFKKMSDKYNNLAFSVKGYTSLDILNKFLTELQTAIKTGSTKEAFRETMNGFLAENGYTGLTPYHSDMIFRQNILTAYSVGHYESMTDPDVISRRKYWQYQTAGDGNVRESHATMDGRVYPADSDIWDTWYPPNGFGCRCIVVSLTPEQVERKGLQIETLLPNTIDPESKAITAALPDKKFRSNPAKAEWRPDMAGFPSSLKKIYAESLQGK